MGRTKREDVQIEQRRQSVASLFLRGWTQSAIAHELKVSQPTISGDLKAIRREWRDSRIRDFDEAVVVELKKLEVVEREAWAAWERSRQPLETSRIVQGETGKHLEKTVQQQVGNPRFLDQVQKSIAGRRSLLGLDAPVRVAPTSPDGSESYHAHVMQELLRLAEASDGGPRVIDTTFVKNMVESQLSTAPAHDQPRYGRDSHE